MVCLDGLRPVHGLGSALLAGFVLAACAGMGIHDRVRVPTEEAVEQPPLEGVGSVREAERVGEAVRSTDEPYRATVAEPSDLKPRQAWNEAAPHPVDPLTGEEAADPTRLQRRPLAIKVSNFPVQGRPHFGLSSADVVFEYFIGGGMTRFLAVFYGRDSLKVGPIRSGRLVDGQLTRLYGGFLGMKGADPYVAQRLYALLPGRVFNAKPSACPALCPETTSHTYGTFADTAAFSRYVKGEGADNSSPELGGMVFDAEPPPGGLEAKHLWMFYAFLNQVAWEYDGASGKYLRSQDYADAVLQPMVDRLTGKRLGFSNVVLLIATHEFISPTIIDIHLWHEEGRRAFVLRDGWLYEVAWSATATDSPLKFFAPNGAPFPFKPGNTWFQIIGTASTVEELEAGNWKVRFRP